MPSNPDYISSRRLGAATVTVINVGTGRYEVELVDSHGQRVPAFGSNEATEAVIGFNVLHIRTTDASVLVDAGFDDPGSDWGKRFQQEWPSVVRTEGVESALRTIGESDESLTHIVLTHAHFDHVAGLAVDRDGKVVPRFPNSQVVLNRSDAVPFEDEAAEDITRRLEVIAGARLLTLVDGDYEVSPGINMLHTGGESTGHSVVRVRSHGETLLTLGDLIHFECEVEHPDWMAPWADREAMLEARQCQFESAASSDALVTFSHHPFPPWGRIVRTPGAYAWREA